jgi:uncharacterized protein (TIGR02466 family)
MKGAEKRMNKQIVDFTINRIPLFTSEVFHFNLPNFEFYQEQIKQIVLVEENGLMRNAPEEECNIMARRTRWNSNDIYPVLQRLSNDIQKYLDIFVEKEGYDTPGMMIRNCWINWYKKGQHAIPHHHAGDLAVVVFVDVEETNAKFFFHEESNYFLIKKSDSEKKFTNIKHLDAKNGTVIFFDGNLRHSVSENTTEKTRITVAFNYMVSYIEKRDDKY